MVHGHLVRGHPRVTQQIDLATRNGTCMVSPEMLEALGTEKKMLVTSAGSESAHMGPDISKITHSEQVFSPPPPLDV